MSSVIRSVLGAAILLTGSSVAIAQSANPPIADQSRKTVASTATVASANAPVAGQPIQIGASAAIAASANAPVADRPHKPHESGLSDNNDPYGGHDPNSSAGSRAFFVPQY